MLLVERKCDSTQKFLQVEDLLHGFLRDESETVANTAAEILLPIFVSWATSTPFFLTLHCEGYLKRAFTICEVW